MVGKNQQNGLIVLQAEVEFDVSKFCEKRSHSMALILQDSQKKDVCDLKFEISVVELEKMGEIGVTQEMLSGQAEGVSVDYQKALDEAKDRN